MQSSTKDAARSFNLNLREAIKLPAEFLGVSKESASSTILPNGINLLYVESLLLWFYNNDRDDQVKEKLLDNDESNNLTTAIKSKLENENARTNLA